jgi:tetratricopeptide (TPR) repeat protein
VQNHQFHEVDQMLDGLFRYYETGGWFHEAVHTAQQAVQILDTPGENNLTTDQKIALGRALIYQGRFDVHIGNYKTGEKSLSRGLEILTKIGQKKHIVFGLYEMAKLNQAFGKQSAARLLLEQCLPIYRELEDLGKIVDVYNNIGITYYHQEEYLAARDYFENSLVIAKLLGNQGRLSRAYNNLGDVARLMHDLTAASSYLRQSLSLCEDLGPSPLMGSILNTLGETHQELGDYTGAARYLHRGLRIAKRLQAVPLILEILVSVAVLWNAKKDQKAAIPLLSLAYHHPATPRAIKKKAHRLLSNTKAGRAALAGIKVQLAAPDLNAMESLISEAMHSLSNSR